MAYLDINNAARARVCVIRTDVILEALKYVHKLRRFGVVCNRQRNAGCNLTLFIVIIRFVV